jgi:hypothetical protein
MTNDPFEINASIEVDLDVETFDQLTALVAHITRNIQIEMIRSFNPPKHGRIYHLKQIVRGPGGQGFAFAPLRRGRPGETRTYTASAPYEAPAIRSGWLKQETGLGFSQVSQFEAEINIPMDYANFLELGTGRVLPRPFVRPAINTVLGALALSEVIERYEPVTQADVWAGVLSGRA